MPRRSILLVSRDDELQFVRSRLLQDAGYQAFLVDTISGGVLLVAAERPQIALLCSSFSVEEQETFIERVQETNSSQFILCLRNGDIGPSDLIEACEQCLRTQPGMSFVRILDGGSVEHFSNQLGGTS